MAAKTRNKRAKEKGGSWEWRRKDGVFQLLFAPRHPLEAGIGLLQVENPPGGP